ncbi:MAG TPA: 30S ribosomal protein S6 [Terriglobales bacterium]|nr:30S ribosomal protein S6 [Terriglobales bacterium]
MRPYEILVILNAGLSDDDSAALLTQLGETVKGLGVEVTKVENWGKRRLAYDINKQREGTYAVFEVSAEPAMIKEFERQLKLNENVLRFLSTQIPIRKKVRGKPRDASPAGGDQPVGDAPSTGDKVLEEVR